MAAAPAHSAAASRRAAPARADVVGDFQVLAQQRPWDCPAAARAGLDATWPDGQAACAWQNRLRRQSWSWSDDGAAACLGTQARWWNRAQAGLPPTALRSVWDRRWTTQTLHMQVGGEERLLLLRRDAKGRWQATEWRWNPNPRPATRRWQEGRWKLLMAAVAQPGFGTPDAGGAEAAPMRPVFRRLLGTRPGELGPEGLTLAAAGLCLQASNPLPGPSRLPLSYSPNDSRLEQRAAMHLQLSRQHPDVRWLTPFKMLDMPASLPSGAKFLATWVEGGQVIGQLWIPQKGDAPVVRVRVGARLPKGPDKEAAALPAAKAAVEQELAAIAQQWAAVHE